jgi:hypothetical protein
MSRGLRYLATKKVAVRTEQGRGRKTLHSLSQGWEPHSKKVFDEIMKKRMRRSRLARKIEKNSVRFGLPGQVTWEELDQLRKYNGSLEADLGFLRRWRTSVKQRPELARISPAHDPAELKKKIKKQEALIRQNWERRGISTVDERGRNLGTSRQDQQGILKHIRRNSGAVNGKPQ